MSRNADFSRQVGRLAFTDEGRAMWEPDEMDLTPEPWHQPMPGLDEGDEDQAQYWNAPSPDEFAHMMGQARKLWAEGYQYGK